MTKYPARHLELLRGNGQTPESFAVVGQVVGMGEVGSSRDAIDASVYGDDWKDWVLGQQDGDEMEVTVAYDPADTGHDGLVADYDAAVKRNFQLRHTPAGFHVQFPALILRLARGGEREGLLTMRLILKIVAPGVQDVVP